MWALGGFVFAVSQTAVALATTGTFAILQGWTTKDSAQISLLRPRGQELRLSALNAAGRSLPVEIQAVHGRLDSPWELLNFEVRGLEAKAGHTLIVRDEQGRVVDSRIFSALDADRSHARLAFGSCMNDHLHNPGTWRVLAEERPDVLVLVGDTVYLDNVGLWTVREPDERQIWNRHVEARNRLAVYRAERLIPVLAIADDHDFGPNNAEGNWRLAAAARKAFREFFPLGPVGTGPERGPGLSFAAELFGHSFVFLDGRSYRDSRAEARNMFGHEGEDWLATRALRPHSFLISGSQMFGGYLSKDSYESNYPEDFARFLRMLRAQPTRFAFVSGDVHFSEVMAIEPEVLGYGTLEITASSLHSFAVPGLHRIYDFIRGPNPRRKAAIGTHNLTLVDIHRPTSDVHFMEVRGLTWRGTPKFQIRFDLNRGQIDPAACEALLRPPS